MVTVSTKAPEFMISLDVIVHQCSVCCYASVHRHNVVRHIGAHACGNKDASVLTKHIKVKCPRTALSNTTTYTTEASPTEAPAAKAKAEAQAAANDQEYSEYVYYVSCPDHGIAKIGRWSGTTRALKSRYSTYYPNPVIYAVPVADARGVEKVLKDAMHARGLNAVHDARRELVQPGDDAVRLFAVVTCGGDPAKLARALVP